MDNKPEIKLDSNSPEENFGVNPEVFPPRLYSGETLLRSNAATGLLRETPGVALDGVDMDLLLARGQDYRQFCHPKITLQSSPRYACVGGQLYEEFRWGLDRADLQILTLPNEKTRLYTDLIMHLFDHLPPSLTQRLQNTVVAEHLPESNFSNYTFIQILIHHLSNGLIDPNAVLPPQKMTKNISYSSALPTPEQILTEVQTRTGTKKKEIARIADWVDLISSGLNADVIERCTAHYATTGYGERQMQTINSTRNLYNRLVSMNVDPRKAFDAAIKLAAYIEPDLEQSNISPQLPDQIDYTDLLALLFVRRITSAELNADVEVSIIRAARSFYSHNTSPTSKDPAIVDACIEATTVRNLGIPGTSTHIFNKLVTAMHFAVNDQDVEIAKIARNYVREVISGDPIHYMTYLFKRIAEMTCDLENAPPEEISNLTQQFINETKILRSCNIRASQETYNNTDQVHGPITDIVLSSMMDLAFRYRYPNLYQAFAQTRSQIHASSEEGRINYYIVRQNIVRLLSCIVANGEASRLRRGRHGIITATLENPETIPLLLDSDDLGSIDLYPSEKSTSKLMRHMTGKAVLQEQLDSLDAMESHFNDHQDEIYDQIAQTVINRHDNLRARIVVSDQDMEEFMRSLGNPTGGVDLIACYVREMTIERTNGKNIIYRKRHDCSANNAVLTLKGLIKPKMKKVNYRAMHLHYNFALANLPYPLKVEFQIIPESARESNHRFESHYGTDILDPEFDESELPSIDMNPWFN